MTALSRWGDRAPARQSDEMTYMTSNPARNRHLTIVVATLTRQRPTMLQALLLSWGRMVLPPDCTLRCLVVENDSAENSRQMVETCRMPNGAALAYVLEPELGIPFARNRAAREAIAGGADLLAFVDDDEEVAPDWLDRLVAGYRRSDAVLIGAPLRIGPLTDPAARWSERLMHRSLSARYLRKEARAARRADLPGCPGVTVVTNNWLAETGLFTEHGLWFDETMRFTGGSDAKFCADARTAGLRVGWVTDAFVHETVPPERLSFLYQFRRGRDQSNTHFLRRIAKRPASRFGVLVSVPLRAVLVMALILALPLTRGRTYVDVARSAGWIVGRLSALAGRRSALYSQVTGN